MIVYKKKLGHSNKKRLVVGSGFVDTISSIFNSMKPTLRNVGSYISTNKDLIAKPLIGALGSLAVTGVTAGGEALLNKIMNKHKNPQIDMPRTLDAKAKEIIQNMLAKPEVLQSVGLSNIIGSGIRGREKKKKKKGSGIKQF